ncbi:MAG: hypothetical protein AAF809_10350 [Bacteroidota bacterium]
MARRPDRMPYRLDDLPVVLPYYRAARAADRLGRGDLVYYGPMPSFYGVGEVVGEIDGFVVVDFRGTGLFGVHEETLDAAYIQPIPAEHLERI